MNTSIYAIILFDTIRAYCNLYEQKNDRMITHPAYELKATPGRSNYRVLSKIYGEKPVLSSKKAPKNHDKFNEHLKIINVQIQLTVNN